MTGKDKRRIVGKSSNLCERRGIKLVLRVVSGEKRRINPSINQMFVTGNGVTGHGVKGSRGNGSPRHGVTGNGSRGQGVMGLRGYGSWGHGVTGPGITDHGGADHGVTG